MVRSRTAYGAEENSSLSRLVLSGELDMQSGPSNFRTTTNSYAPNQGAVMLSGGLGVEKNVFIGNDLHVLTRGNGSVVLGSEGSVSSIYINSRVTTDVVPFTDSDVDLGTVPLRWDSVYANRIANPDGILLESENGDVGVGVTVQRLFTRQNLNVIDDAFFHSNVVVQGNFDVRGMSTVVQSETVTIKDKNIALGYIVDGTPDDDTADGGGITVKGATDKVLAWYNSDDLIHPNAWGSSENVDIAEGKFVRTDVVKARSAAAGLQLWDSAGPISIMIDGKLGVNTLLPQVTVHIEGSDAMKLPVGTTSQQPAAPQLGYVRYNTDLHRYEGFGTGDVWGSLGGVVDISQTTYISVLTDDYSADVHKIRFFVNDVEIADFDGLGRLGIGVTVPRFFVHMESTDALKIPVGTTAERPAVPELGCIRYNSDLHRYEGWQVGDVFATLGGVVDLEQTTYISVLNDAGDADVHKIRFFTNGTEVADFDADGRLGVGITVPRFFMHLESTDALKIPVGTTSERPAQPELGCIRYNTDLHRYEGWQVGDTYGSLGGVVDLEQTTLISVLNDAGDADVHKIRFFTNGVENMLLDPVGKLGIGTLAPLSRLDVAGSVAVGSGYAGVSVAPNNGLLVQGIVGVGVSEPLVTLDVVGVDGIRIPVGSTAERPATEELGMVRYNTTRNRYEALNMVGTPDAGVQTWLSLSGVSNDDDTAFVIANDPNDGTSLEEVRFYTSTTFDSNGGVLTGYRGKFDQYGNLGLGGASTRVLSSMLDIEDPHAEQITVRYDASNNATFSVSATGNLTLQTHPNDPITNGNINLIPGSVNRRVNVGDPNDVFDKDLFNVEVIPTRLAVYGYAYLPQGIKFGDGSLQLTSAQQTSSGTPFGQFYMSSISAGVSLFYPPIDTTRVAIGSSVGSAKLSVALTTDDDPALPQLELRMTDTRYATMKVDSNGSLFVTAGLAQDSDILLQPSGNVGIGVDSANASLHVDYDLFLQSNDSDDNTVTGLGLYLRFKDDTAVSGTQFGVLTSGSNATAEYYPLQINASDVTLPQLSGAFGINTSTPASKLGVAGNMAVGETYGSSNAAPNSGLAVEGDIGVATYEPNARLEVVDSDTGHGMVLLVTQDNDDVQGVVIRNSVAGTEATSGVRIACSNVGAGNIDVVGDSAVATLNLQPSAGLLTIGGTLTDAQATVNQVSASANRPVLSLHQGNAAGAVMKLVGSAVLGNTTRTLVLNDAAVSDAVIEGFVQVSVTDTNGNLASGVYYLPLLTLT